MQFPYAAVVEVEKTEEELAKAAERRRLQGRKLQEIAAAKRAEKVRILNNGAFFLYCTKLKHPCLAHDPGGVASELDYHNGLQSLDDGRGMETEAQVGELCQRS